ncbi:SRPBCC family protein [Nocardioidaceae bacterium]|nr:SRPBCC family protein [Nocardioidaceae bacterium]
MTTERISATHVLPATSAQVFAVLADPSAHAAIDGTGWVTDAVDAAPLTHVGQLFAMGMFHERGGGAYETVNEVTAFEAGRVIAWRTGYQERGDDELTVGGWWWRYDLEPSTEGTTVTLTYDWSAVGAEPRTYLDFPPFPAHHLPNSLHHLETLATRGRKERR